MLRLIIVGVICATGLSASATEASKEAAVDHATIRKQNWHKWEKSWRKISSVERAQLLKDSFTDQTKFVNPAFQGQGIKEFTAVLEEFQARRPGAYFETIEFLAHHDVMHAKWEMSDASGKKIGSGYNTAVFGSDDKIIEIKGFFIP